MAQAAQNEESVDEWLERIKLTKYSKLLKDMGFTSLDSIAGLTPQEFKNALKSELQKTVGNDIPWSDLGTFGSAVQKLRGAQGQQGQPPLLMKLGGSVAASHMKEYSPMFEAATKNGKKWVVIGENIDNQYMATEFADFFDKSNEVSRESYMGRRKYWIHKCKSLTNKINETKPYPFYYDENNIEKLCVGEDSLKLVLPHQIELGGMSAKFDGVVCLFARDSKKDSDAAFARSGIDGKDILLGSKEEKEKEKKKEKKNENDDNHMKLVYDVMQDIRANVLFTIQYKTANKGNADAQKQNKVQKKRQYNQMRTGNSSSSRTSSHSDTLWQVVGEFIVITLLSTNEDKDAIFSISTSLNDLEMGWIVYYSGKNDVMMACKTTCAQISTVCDNAIISGRAQGGLPDCVAPPWQGKGRMGISNAAGAQFIINDKKIDISESNKEKDSGKDDGVITTNKSNDNN